MTTSHSTHRPPTPWAEHECSPEMCTHGVRDVAHREVPDTFTPWKDGDPTRRSFSFGMERHEELDGDGNVTSTRVIAAIGLGAEAEDLSVDELRAYRGALAGLERRMRAALTAAPSPADR